MFIDKVSYQKFAAKALSPETKVVSADVFDTLLLRSPKPECHRFLEIGRRHLVFLQGLGYAQATTEQDLLTLRILAAKAAYRNVRQVSGVREAQYADFMSIVLKALACPLDLCDPLRKVELEYEQSVLYPNEFLVDIFKQAVRAGKRIICISDMYFTSAEIAGLITPHIPDLAFSYVYASSDYGISKASGLLYRFIAEQESVQPGQIAHCGDSRHSDFIMARQQGVEAVFVPRTASWRGTRWVWQKYFQMHYGIV